MKKITNEDLNPKVFELFDNYVHSKIDRRQFMEQVSVYAIGGLTASAIFEYLSPKYDKIQIEPTHEGVRSKYKKYASPKGGGKMRGLLAKPAKVKGKLPGVIVVHENRGLNPHIEDVARRAALAGFLAFAPDALFPLGGYPGNDDDGRTMLGTRDKDEMLEDFIAAFQFLKSHPKCTGKVGVVGFCFGGWISNMMAVRVPDLGASVPFYGGQPAQEEVPNIHAPLQLHFASEDQRVNEGWPAYEEALKKHNKMYKAYWYEGLQHGFHNDTTPRYDEKGAKLAWSRTIEFFKEKLK